MRYFALTVALFHVLIWVNCTSSPKNTNLTSKALDPIPISTPAVPKDGDYRGRGKVTRIEAMGGSIELDFEEIPNASPAMKKEFLVSDKAVLKGLKLGDLVEFTLRYNNGQATVVSLSKEK